LQRHQQDPPALLPRPRPPVGHREGRAAAEEPLRRPPGAVHGGRGALLPARGPRPPHPERVRPAPQPAGPRPQPHGVRRRVAGGGARAPLRDGGAAPAALRDDRVRARPARGGGPGGSRPRRARGRLGGGLAPGVSPGDGELRALRPTAGRPGGGADGRRGRGGCVRRLPAARTRGRRRLPPGGPRDVPWGAAPRASRGPRLAQGSGQGLPRDASGAREPASLPRPVHRAARLMHRLAPTTRRALVACAMAALAPAACAPAPPRTGRPAPLSADSAALLERAIRLARPGFPTQQEALRAGAYRHPDAAVAAGPVPAPPAEVRSAPDTRSSYVIQIAAFRDRASAEPLAREARERFPDLGAVVEEEGDLFRVALGDRMRAGPVGWAEAGDAERVLPRVREGYPTAWVRGRNVP